METQQYSPEQQENWNNDSVRTPEETELVLQQMLAKLEEKDFKATLKQIDFEDTLARAREWSPVNETAMEADFDALLDEAYSHPAIEN